MAIQGNIGVAITGLAATNTDTAIIATGANRIAVTGFSIFNTTASTSVVVDIYESPNATSASGKKVASYNIPGNSSIDVVECIGQGYATTTQIVAKITTSAISLNDLNAKLSYTLYTAGS